MSVEYGIVSMTTIGTVWDSSGENGWRFRPTESFQVCGFRSLTPSGDTGTTCNLWDVASGTLLATAEITPQSEWVEVYLDFPVTLEVGKTYAVTKVCTKVYYYGGASANTTFNSKLSYISGTYRRPSTGVMPSATESNYMYPHIDIIIGEPPPTYDKKYLIRSFSTLYTVTDGTLAALAETELTASQFQTYGMDDLPDGSMLVGLTNPEVLYWHDSTDDLPVLTAAVTGAPPVPQVVVTDAQDMSDRTILGIESVSIEASADVLWALSFDDGTSWKAYDGTQWVTLEQENSGMTAETFQNIPLEAWAEIVTSDSYRVRFVLMDTTSYVTSLVIHYLN